MSDKETQSHARRWGFTEGAELHRGCIAQLESMREQVEQEREINERLRWFLSDRHAQIEELTKRRDEAIRKLDEQGPAK
jgi:hypothetical protein